MLKIFPFIFRVLLIYFLAFIWMRFLVSNLLLVLLYTSLITLGIEGVFTYFIRRRQKKRQLRGAKHKKMVDMTDTIAMWNKDMQIDFFILLAKKRHHCEVMNVSAAHNKAIKIMHDIGSVALFSAMKFTPLSADCLAEMMESVQMKNKNEKRKNIEDSNNPQFLIIKKLIIACLSASPEAKRLAADFSAFPIVILEREDVYTSLLCEYNFFPADEEIFKRKVTTKRKFKELFGGALSRSRTRGYLLCAIFLSFASMFVRWNWYYIIMASLLLCLAITSLLLPYFKKGEKGGVLD